MLPILIGLKVMEYGGVEINDEIADLQVRREDGKPETKWIERKCKCDTEMRLG